jgi:hypothetical protein
MAGKDEIDDPPLLGRLNDGRELPIWPCNCGRCGNEWFMAALSEEWMPSYCPYCGIRFVRRDCGGDPAAYRPQGGGGMP